MKTIIVFPLIYLLSNTLLVLSSTNLFTESFFQGKYFIVYLVMMLSTIATIKVCAEHFKRETALDD